MWSRIAAFLLVCLAASLSGFPDRAEAQYRTTASAYSEGAFRKLGLERAWQTQVEFDATRGKLAGVSQHISSKSAQTIVEVTYPGGRKVFSERDLDAFNRPLGAKGARAEAEIWIENWKLRTGSKAEPEISEQVVPDVVLVATSQRGTVQCINAETGRTLWSNKVGSTRHPTTSAGINETHVAVINGSTLYMLDRADGHVLWERTTSHPAGNGPALSDELVFIPMVDGHMDLFHIKEPRRPVASFQSHGRCLVQPVVFRDAVAWPTDRGSLYIGNAEVAGIRFRINAKDKIDSSQTAIHSAPTFRAGIGELPPLVYFATSDGYVYSAETLKGAIVNRFSAGESISSTPVVIGDQVYVVTNSGTLFCIGADDAQERWFTTGIKSFLAANFKRLYCLDRDNRLVGFDAETGSPLGAIGLGEIDYSFLNTQSDRIYVGTSSGALQCLREMRQYYPFVHGGMEPKKQFAEVNQPSQDSEEEAMEKPEATTEEDPFDADKPEKPAVPAAEDEDPFGK